MKFQKTLVVILLILPILSIMLPSRVQANCLGTVKCRPFNFTARTCGSSGYANTGCGAATSQYSCNISYDWAKECDGGCYITDTCEWSGTSSPTATPRPGDPTPTPVSGGTDYGDRWRIKGEVLNSANGKVSGANVSVRYGNGSIDRVTTDAQGIFSIDKRLENVPNGTYQVTASAAGYNPMSPTYNVGGCNEDASKYSCDKYNAATNYEAPKIYNFKAVPPTPTPATANAPECSSFTGLDTITKGSTYKYTVGARDLDNGTNNGAGIGFVQMYWRTPGGSDWKLVSANDSSATYDFYLNTNDVAVTGASRKIELVANVYKVSNCLPYNKSCTTGNLGSNESQWTESTACRKEVTVNTVSNLPPTGSFSQYPPATVPIGSTAPLQGRCTDSNGNLTYCYMLRRQRPAGGAWSAWSAPILQASNVNGTGTLTTSLQSWVCNSNQAGMGHEWVVEAFDKAGAKCTGKVDKLSGWNDCGASDRVVFTCGTVASPTPVPNQCSAITVANPVNNCGGTTKSVRIDYTQASFCSSYEIQKATNTAFTADLYSATDNNADKNGSFTYTGLTKSIPQYFRVRCIAKSASATCSVPGAWSATKTSPACPGSPTSTPAPTLRTCGQTCNTTTLLCNTSLGLTCRNSVCRNASCTNAQQNASCVCQGAPTPTPAPSTCSSPSGLSCGGTCNAAGQMQVSCSWTRDDRVSGFRFSYDNDSGFGTDATNINLTTSGTSANATYTMSSALPNVQHWFRVSNRISDGSCDAALNQTSNTSTTGPAVCSTYSCTRTRPINSTIHNNDEPPTGGDLDWRHSTVDNTRQCEFFCDAGYTYNSTSNTCDSTAFTCGGTRPANTLYYSGDNNPTRSGVNWTYASPNTTAKCEFFCDTGYQWNNATGSCELPGNACVAPGNTTGSITCTNGGSLDASWNAITGASSYRYQRNTSPTTTGAVTAVINGTSFEVPIDEPDVTNYFRVRVQTVNASASCTAVGAWSAWRSVAANTSCAEPTDILTACMRPSAVTVTEACSPVPQIGATWRKVAGVTRYEYQVRRVGDTWANKVDDGFVTQPLSAADPVMPAYLTEANPPEYNVRVRSICDDGSGGETTTLWRTGVSNFVPPACGGPTPTPLPPPTYDMTVNVRVTDDNNCTDSDPFLTGSDGRIRVDPPDPDPIYSENVPASGTLTLSGLSGINIIRPVWPGFGDDDTPAYSRAQLAGCSNPFSQTVTDASDGPLNFYFTEVSGPWWQSSFGDVYGDRLLSKIPSSANNKNLSISSSESEAGAVAWNVAADLSTGTPSQKGYQIDQRLPFLEDVDYFANKLSNSLQTVASNNILAVNVDNDGVYRLTGPQTINASWNSVSGKVVVLIDGPNAALRVEGPDVPLGMNPGGFVFFIVDGPITIAPEVKEVYGMFLATDDITIEYDIANQQAFKGHGSFVSTGGDIVSYRSLEGSNNSTAPATEFIYDPSLVINTPPVLRTNATVWEEVAP
jgi:hypothetical protein